MIAKTCAYVLVMLVHGFQSIDSVLFSSNRLSKGIRDITSLAKIIELKSVEYAESFKDYVALPTQLRSKPFKASRRNMLAENPIVWHCFYCSDTNRFNDRLDIFNQFNYSELPLSLPVDNYDRLCHSFLPPPPSSYASTVSSVEQGNFSTAKSPSSSFIVFDFGSAVFDLKEEIKPEDIEIGMEESPEVVPSETTSDLPESATEDILSGTKTTADKEVLHPTASTTTETTNTAEHSNVANCVPISPVIPPTLEVSEPSQDTPDIRKNTNTKQRKEETEAGGSVEEEKMKQQHDDATSAPPEEAESDSEIVLSHIPIAILFFLVGLVFAYSVDAARSYLRDYLVARERKYVDYLELTAIDLLKDNKFAAAANLLKGAMQRVVKFRGEQHADTAALHHFLAKAYIGLKDGVAAEKSLEEARKIYEPYGEDMHMAQVLEDLGIALKLQNRLEESKQKMFMALKIFTEEALIEESASTMGSGCYSFSSSISTASNYSIDSNSISSSCGSADLDGYNIENFMRNDYSSKKREIAKLNVMTQTSNQSTPATTIPLPGSAASPPSAGGTTTSMFSPPPFQNGESHDWNGSNLDDLDSYHVDDPDHLLPYEVSDVLKRKYVIDSDLDFWNEVETLEDMLKPTSSSRGSNFLNENQLRGMHRVGAEEHPLSRHGMLNSEALHLDTNALRSSACEDDDRKKKLAKVNKDVARVEWSIANLLDEGGDLEKAQVYYLHSKRLYSELKDDDCSTVVGEIQSSLDSVLSRMRPSNTPYIHHPHSQPPPPPPPPQPQPQHPQYQHPQQVRYHTREQHLYPFAGSGSGSGSGHTGKKSDGSPNTVVFTDH